jgi:hypothetical protein
MKATGGEKERRSRVEGDIISQRGLSGDESSRFNREASGVLAFWKLGERRGALRNLG